MGQIVHLPRRHRFRKGLVIALYTDEEIDLTVAAINLHNPEMTRVTAESLSTLEAETVEFCLKQASVNRLLSTQARNLALQILNSIEHISIRQTN
jgi:hypothetical protein